MSKGKKIAIILSVLSIFILLFGTRTQIYLYENEYYTFLFEEKVDEEVKEHIRKAAYQLMLQVAESEQTYVIYSYGPFKTDISNVRYMLKKANGDLVATNVMTDVRDNVNAWDYSISFNVKNFGLGPYIETHMNKEILKDGYYIFYAFVDKTFPVEDEYKNIYDTYNYANLLNIAIYTILISSLVVGSISLAYLSGMFCKKQENEIENQSKQKLRMLIVLIVAAVVCYMKLDQVKAEWMMSFQYLYTYVIYPLLSIFISFVLVLSLKLFYSPMLLEKGKKIFLGIFEKVKIIFKKLSLVKRASLIVFGIVLLELFLIKACWNNMEIYVILWVLEKFIILPFIFMVLLDLRKIKIAGEEYASGNLEYQLQTENMNWDFKKHAENMNKIADGLNIALEKRIQSERMKTELITNVSHDIKTPIMQVLLKKSLVNPKSIKNTQRYWFEKPLI